MGGLAYGIPRNDENFLPLEEDENEPITWPREGIVTTGSLKNWWVSLNSVGDDEVLSLNLFK